MSNFLKEQTVNLLDKLREAVEENTAATEYGLKKITEGEYYGDTLPDSLADIALSLRILSGREQLKK